MELTNKWSRLFRQETYAHQLALYEDADLKNPFEGLLRRKEIDGTWDKDYSVIPVGRLEGRKEAEPIPLVNQAPGQETYGALKIEISAKTSLSKHMKLWAKKFSAAGGQSPESSFAGYLADAAARGIMARGMFAEHEYFATIFNRGAIQAGDAFFNQHERAENTPDVPNINTIYDGVCLFTFADNPHPAQSGNTQAEGAAPTGPNCGWGAANAATAIADTGGYFNAFQLPPSYWALKRVWTHFENNISYDEQDIPYAQTPDVLVISAYNEAHWMEVMKSRFVAYTQDNTENLFMEQGGRFRVRVVVSRLLLRNTWFLGKANSPGIYRLYPSTEDNPWSYWREESNRTYFMSYERSWGFWVRNWRYWIGGSVSTDGITPPEYGAANAWEDAADTQSYV